MYDLRVDRSVTIPANELEFKFTTSSGPGGQHANKSSTRVEVSWNVLASSALSSRQKERVAGVLRHRLTGAGVLKLASDTHRSQMLNRKEVLDRLARLVADALRPKGRRVHTVPSEGARAERVRVKRHRSRVKKLRQAPQGED